MTTTYEYITVYAEGQYLQDVLNSFGTNGWRLRRRLEGINAWLLEREKPSETVVTNTFNVAAAKTVAEPGFTEQEIRDAFLACERHNRLNPHEYVDPAERFNYSPSDWAHARANNFMQALWGAL